MKKIVLFGVMGLILLVVGFVVVGVMSINPLVVKAVNEYGPELVGAPVHLDKSDISIFSGEGALSGLVVGNPKGYKSKEALSLGGVSVKVDKNSLTTDRIVINDITVAAPRITYELSGGRSNIQALADNVKRLAGEEKAAEKTRSDAGREEPGGEQKIQIDNLLITGGEVTLAVTGLGGEVMTVPLPDIHLTGIGADDDGATPAEAFGEVMAAVNKSVGGAASGALGDIRKGLEQGAEQLKKSGEDLKKGVEGLGDGLKKMFQ